MQSIYSKYKVFFIKSNQALIFNRSDGYVKMAEPFLGYDIADQTCANF